MKIAHTSALACLIALLSGTAAYADDCSGRDHTRGTLSRYEARRFSERLHQIQYRADAQQRRGRFNPQAIEAQLVQLREEMRDARRSNRDERVNYNRR